MFRLSPPKLYVDSDGQKSSKLMEIPPTNPTQKIVFLVDIRVQAALSGSKVILS